MSEIKVAERSASREAGVEVVGWGLACLHVLKPDTAPLRAPSS